MTKPQYSKVAELRALAKQYQNYADTMRKDPFATRWMVIAEALRFQADALAQTEPPVSSDLFAPHPEPPDPDDAPGPS